LAAGKPAIAKLNRSETQQQRGSSSVMKQNHSRHDRISRTQQNIIAISFTILYF